MTAMRHGHEIGHGEMALAVARVWSGRDSGGIGRPHCRSRPGGGPHMRFGFLNSGSQLCKPDAVGPLMGEEKRSEESSVGEECVSTYRAWWSAYHKQKTVYTRKIVAIQRQHCRQRRNNKIRE